MADAQGLSDAEVAAACKEPDPSTKVPASNSPKLVYTDASNDSVVRLTATATALAFLL